MLDAVPPQFAAWESFYVIVGSSGAALTGLQFIVIAFIADSGQKLTEATVNTFATPAIVHFCVVLFLAAVLSAPWHTLRTPAFVLGASGLVGIIHTGLVLFRARRQTGYKLVFEDWVWYSGLPFVAYAMLFGSSVALQADWSQALFVIATAALMLLFIGIHSAWDTVTYIAIQRTARETSSTSAPAAAPAPSRKHRNSKASG